VSITEQMMNCKQTIQLLTNGCSF